jgi:hypothetical protein
MLNNIPKLSVIKKTLKSIDFLMKNFFTFVLHNSVIR